MKLFNKIIQQSLEKNSLSHCYLIVGNQNLLENGFWLSSVLMSKELDNQDLIERFRNNEAVDFVLLDGDRGIIKKEEVTEVQNRFANTAVEVYQHKVMLMHQCHVASPQTLNAILKMIEEPNDTSFVLTTNQIEAVLPTIRSRCIILNLESDNEEIVEVQWAQEFLEIMNINRKQACLSLVLKASASLEGIKNGLNYINHHLKDRIYQQSMTEFDLKCYKIFSQCLSELSPSTNLPLCVDHVVYQLLEE